MGREMNRKLMAAVFLAAAWIGLCGAANGKPASVHENYYQMVLDAVRAKDMSQCERTGYKEVQDQYSTIPTESLYFCKADYALFTGDVALCMTLDERAVIPGTASQRATCLYDLAVKLKKPEICGDATMVAFCKQRIADAAACLTSPKKGAGFQEAIDREVGCLAYSNFSSGKPVICDVVGIPGNDAATAQGRNYCWGKVESGEWQGYVEKAVELQETNGGH